MADKPKAAPKYAAVETANRLRPVTVATLLDMKRKGLKIAMLTAYDFPTARIAEEAGVDVILVGDSVAMTKLGYESTLPVTMDEMLHHRLAGFSWRKLYPPHDADLSQVCAVLR